MKSLLPTIRDAWSWIGLNPAEILATNPFGNILVRATDGTIWRISPEELTCTPVAQNIADLQRLQQTSEFQTDWQMSRLVQIAYEKLGPLPDGRCYSLKIPAALGGKYEATNFATITLRELLSYSADVAHQIKDLPDGTPIKLKVID